MNLDKCPWYVLFSNKDENLLINEIITSGKNKIACSNTFKLKKEKITAVKF